MRETNGFGGAGVTFSEQTAVMAWDQTEAHIAELHDLNDALEAEVQVIEIDGLLWDAETGECLTKDRFEITDDASAEWVLQRIQNAQVRRNALVMKRDAITENLNREIRREEASVKSLLFRFENELVNYARQQLAERGGKTLRLAYGSVSFRTKPGKVKVKDKDRALAWAKGLGDRMSHAIKVTEEFQISRLSPTEVEKIELFLRDPHAALDAPSDDAWMAAALEYEEAAETAKVDTGIKEL